MSLKILLASTAVASAALGRTVEIAKGVHMPTMNLGTCCGSDPEIGVPGWIEAGAYGIDTAWDYKIQPVIKKKLAELGVKREDVFLTTKVPAGTGSFTGDAGTCDENVETSLNYVLADLEELGVDYVDLVLLHGPCELMNVTDPTASNNALWRGLELALKLGWTKAIGVSNYETSQLKALKGTVPAVNQCYMTINGTTGYFPPHNARDEETIAYCQANGITYESYEAVSGCPYKDEGVQAIAKAHGKTEVQVCLRWTLERGCAIAAGTGSDPSTADVYAQQNNDIYDFELTQDEIDYLSTFGV